LTFTVGFLEQALLPVLLILLELDSAEFAQMQAHGMDVVIQQDDVFVGTGYVQLGCLVVVLPCCRFACISVEHEGDKTTAHSFAAAILPSKLRV